MARRALTDTCLRLVQRVEAVVGSAVAATGATTCRVGLSGGADSLALTAAMAWAVHHRAGPLNGIGLSAVIVDHQLQPGSAEVATRAQAQAISLGVAAEVVTVTVADGRDGVEAAARQARYAALDTDDSLILLGHTQDDQAETVLLGLARGSGVRSLAGMAERRGRIVRPFLTVRRIDTEQACRDWNLTWWDDPTNQDGRFARSRLRQAMGTLEVALGPGLAQSLARTADLCRADADLLDTMTDAIGLTPTSSDLPVDQLSEHPAPIRQRFLLAWLRTVGGDEVTRAHVGAVDALITDWHGQRSISVPKAQVTRRFGRLFLDVRAPDHVERDEN
ncbi:MAG: tRNA lysidine(34) synthetase TilS [Propionibacteriaceae bacterium]|jgi:tRNA(Ile)-lysidine synthase|nr:tRNA lysidine(34) synthetase TilS [Propionibacteriaceae bacterium]